VKHLLTQRDPIVALFELLARTEEFLSVLILNLAALSKMVSNESCITIIVAASESVFKSVMYILSESSSEPQHVTWDPPSLLCTSCLHRASQSEIHVTCRSPGLLCAYWCLKSSGEFQIHTIRPLWCPCRPCYPGELLCKTFQFRLQFPGLYETIYLTKPFRPIVKLSQVLLYSATVSRSGMLWISQLCTELHQLLKVPMVKLASLLENSDCNHR
jgi:hypothetical protein